MLSGRPGGIWFFFLHLLNKSHLESIQRPDIAYIEFGESSHAMIANSVSRFRVNTLICHGHLEDTLDAYMAF